MDTFFIAICKAYAVGAGCSAGVVTLAKFLPMDDQIRKIVQLVLPIPPTAIALVMMTYGPNSSDQFAMTYGQGNLPLEAFFIGLSSGPLAAITLIVIEMIKKRIQAKALGHT